MSFFVDVVLHFQRIVAVSVDSTDINIGPTMHRVPQPMCTWHHVDGDSTECDVERSVCQRDSLLRDYTVRMSRAFVHASSRDCSLYIRARTVFVCERMC